MTSSALTIAGTDSSGGAGVAADLKTFVAHGVWGMCAVTAVTAQDHNGVHGIYEIAADMVAMQIAPADAVKTGMLPTEAHVEVVLREVGPQTPLVIDPVLRSTSGTRLSVITPRLIARATVITPNREEARALTGSPDPAGAARRLVEMGADVAMVTGSESARDVVATATAPDVLSLDGTFIDAANTHGTGCILSAAIAAEIAKGMDPVDACVAAKHFVAHALADGFPYF
jgi:hydroxymethylpyrimidine/phosphomethylpyrimidine kinase